MRDKILKGKKLNDILLKSVKLNRIFFKTHDMNEFYKLNKPEEMKDYCAGVLDEIINKLKPKRILAESFGTFESLSKQWTSILDKESKNKSLLLAGQYKGIEIFGINHPSQAWRQGINDDDWDGVNKELEKRLD